MKKFALILFSILLTACISHPYLAKQQYLLQAQPPLFKIVKPIKANLIIEPTLASPPFDGLQFIYRLKDARYISDYYNIFMTPPSTQITNELTRFLQGSHLFNNVNSANLILSANYQLKTQLTALYADYSNDQHPKAVVEMQFILVKGNNIVFHKLLAAHVGLARKSTDALVKAWNKGLSIIFTKFSLALAHKFHLTLPKNEVTNSMNNVANSNANFLNLNPLRFQ